MGCRPRSTCRLGVVAEIHPDGPITVAVAQAPASGRETADAPVRIGPEDVTVEIRGAGNATRQINHIITPEFPADRLEVVEVLTPSGNWSSWPPHKHDTDDMPREAILEEIYHYRFRRPEAWGVQRLYGGSIEGLWAVRDGETVIVRDGYHPFVATHGDDAYYLNALAGDIRTMACSFDPALDHVREAWAQMEPDPRVPLVGAKGRDQARAAQAGGRASPPLEPGPCPTRPAQGPTPVVSRADPRCSRHASSPRSPCRHRVPSRRDLRGMRDREPGRQQVL